jgi:hypothetical protein
MQLTARAADGEPAKTINVKLGAESHALIFNSDQNSDQFSDQLIDFAVPEAADTIEFKPSGIVGYRQIQVDSADVAYEPRGALGIAALRLLNSNCETLKRTVSEPKHQGAHLR